MRLSVIVSTYNQPDWLGLVLWGLSVQTLGEFELLIADDGSEGETGVVIERMSRQTWLRPLHVWHSDRGFRKCAILNRAIERASGEYLIFLDGDCIPRGDFVQRHATLAERGRFLSGGAVRLPMEVSRTITSEDVVEGRSHQWRWLRSRGLPWSRAILKFCGRGDSAGCLLDAITPTKPTFNGGNVSAWRDDLLRVNGFDERMGHGGLDRELGQRLENAGVRGRQVRHRCLCVHLDHPRGYADVRIKALNDELRRDAAVDRATWTPHGVVPLALAEAGHGPLRNGN